MLSVPLKLLGCTDKAYGIELVDSPLLGCLTKNVKHFDKQSLFPADAT